MVPRTSLDTRRPLGPNARYLMCALPPVETRQSVRTVCLIANLGLGMVRGRKPGPTSGRDVKADIVHAFDSLLRSRRFDEVAVADVLEAAEVSRSSFYFYFESKHDLLAELVRRAVGVGHEAAQPWLQVVPGDD